MDAVVDCIELYMPSKVNSPHYLMELSTSEVKSLENNMITLGGLSFESKTKKGQKISTYEDVNVGKGVHLKESIIN